MRNLLRHIRQSLSMKLSFSILLMTVPVFIVALGILFVQSRNNIRRQAVEHANSVLNTTAQRVIRYLNTVETATNANDWLVTENLTPEGLLDLSRHIVQMNANVSGCSITMEPNLFPQFGRFFSAYSVRKGDSITTVRESEYEYFDKVWYKTPRTLGKACWVDPFDDFNEGTLSADGMITSYCKPLYQDGRFIGVISSDLSLQQLAEVINIEKPYPHAYFMLVGGDGQYYVRPDSIPADDEPSMVNYCPVEGTDWSLALVCPEKDILQSYYQLTNIVILLLGIGLLLILWLCHRIVTHAIRPLKQLEAQSQRIAAGQYDEQIAHTSRRDAVGRLQNSFAAMQESLDRHLGDIRKLNEQTAQRNEELQQASALAEEANQQKTVFIQNMMHQIRTPLHIIMGFAQILRDSIKDVPVEEVQNITDTMRHNAMTLNRMVLMLYDSSDSGLTEELNTFDYEDVPCNEVARESIAATRVHFPDLSIDFETAVPDALTIRTNRLYLMRSLREILYNSAKYSDREHIALRITKETDRVRLVFEDTGPGIAEEYQEQVFTLFCKVNDLSEGLGLGLALAKRHIQNLGGSLTLDTDYHEGCRFVVELPL